MRKKPASSIASLFADGYGRTGGCLVWEFEAVFGRTEGENLPFLFPASLSPPWPHPPCPAGSVPAPPALYPHHPDGHSPQSEEHDGGRRG